VSEKLVNARRVCKGWVVLSALDVLDTVTAAICYRNKTCSLARGKGKWSAVQVARVLERL